MKQTRKNKKSGKAHLIYVRKLEAKDHTMLTEISKETKKDSNAFNVMYASHKYLESRATILKLQKQLAEKSKETESWEAMAKAFSFSVCESVSVVDELRDFADKIQRLSKGRDKFLKRAKLDINKVKKGSYNFFENEDDES